MILTRDEAISIILYFSEKHSIFSVTKLNKLLARLNLYLIPIDIDFSLNKYGSYNADLSVLESTEYYTIIPVKYKERIVKEYLLTEKGAQLCKTVEEKKLKKILSEEELNNLSNNIHELSQKRADEISADEHKKLLVDVEDNFKLKQRINELTVDLYDLQSQLNKITERSIADIKFKALIEYCSSLITYLKNKFDRRPDDGTEYDFDAYMFDYYFINALYEHILPFLKTEITVEHKNLLKINKYYQFIVESVRDRYPFSIYNKDLKDLIVI